MSGKMKFGVVAAFMLTIVAISCQKGLKGPDNSSNESIAVSADEVKKGEPLAASVSEYSGNVTWSVSPQQGVDIDAEANEATITFLRAGSYTLTALTSNGVVSRPVSVKDSSMGGGDSTGGGGDSTGGGFDSGYVASLAGDQITMRPVSDSGGLAFFSITRNKYECRNNYLLYTQLADTGLNVSFTGVQIPGDCFGGRTKARAYIFDKTYRPGTYPVKVKLNGVLYQGSVRVTATEYIFTWPHTSGVIISPKRIAR